jgi:hypothetical protein
MLLPATRSWGVTTCSLQVRALAEPSHTQTEVNPLSYNRVTHLREDHPPPSVMLACAAWACNRFDNPAASASCQLSELLCQHEVVFMLLTACASDVCRHGGYAVVHLPHHLGPG